MAHPRSHIGGGGSGHLYGLSGLRDDEEDLDVDPRQHQLSASQHRHPQHTQQTQHYSHQSHHTLSQHHQQHAPPPLQHALQQPQHSQHPQHTQQAQHTPLPQLSHATHHHHHLPDQPAPLKMPRAGPGPSGINVTVGAAGPSTTVTGGPGTAGMPQPQPRARGPKQKFTPEDDQLLVDLKENKALTWKQISEYFPGRSSGTLQVRYCTKLKAKGNLWTDETVQRLRNAIDDYERDKWRLIAAKVGNGFTANACREKATEL